MSPAPDIAQVSKLYENEVAALFIVGISTKSIRVRLVSHDLLQALRSFVVWLMCSQSLYGKAWVTPIQSASKSIMISTDTGDVVNVLRRSVYTAYGRSVRSEKRDFKYSLEVSIY